MNPKNDDRWTFGQVEPEPEPEPNEPEKPGGGGQVTDNEDPA